MIGMHAYIELSNNPNVANLPSIHGMFGHLKTLAMCSLSSSKQMSMAIPLHTIQHTQLLFWEGLLCHPDVLPSLVSLFPCASRREISIKEVLCHPVLVQATS